MLMLTSLPHVVNFLGTKALLMLLTHEASLALHPLAVSCLWVKLPSSLYTVPCNGSWKTLGTCCFWLFLKTSIYFCKATPPPLLVMCYKNEDSILLLSNSITVVINANWGLRVFHQHPAAQSSLLFIFWVDISEVENYKGVNLLQLLEENHPQ